LVERVCLQSEGAGNGGLGDTVPTRGMIGLRNRFLTATRGNCIMGSRFVGYEPW